MTVWLSTLLLGFLTALRFASLPALALLVAFSLLWKRRTGAWVPLWKLGLALIVITLLASFGFAFVWHGAVSADP